jgi:hypothetical protein
MVVLTSDQQQYLQNTGQTPPANIGDGVIQPAAVPAATVPPTVSPPVPAQPISLVNRTPQGPAPQTSLQTPLSSLPPAPTSGKGGMGFPAQPSQPPTQEVDPRNPQFGLPVIPPPSTVFPPPALPTPLPLPPQGSTTSLVQRRPTDAVNASVPSARSGKGGGTPTQPQFQTGTNSFFSPAYTPTVYDTGDAYSGSDYVDEFFDIGSGNTASLQELSTAIQPGAIVGGDEPEDTGPTDAEIQAPKPGEPLTGLDDDDDFNGD